MRILIVGINFAPELVGIGKYTAEMVEWLAGQGHEIRMVTAPPYYPKWQVWGGYSAWRYHVVNTDKVRIYRCPLWVPEKVSGFKRILHLLSFSLSAVPVLVTLISWKPALVLNVAPAIFSAPMALTAARMTGAKAWLHIQDFEIDAAFDLGLLANNPFKEVITGLERLLLRKFDWVSTISNQMVERLHQKKVPRDKTLLFPNWVDSETIYPLKGSNPIRMELGIPEEKIVVLYSGNMGQKQGIEILIDVAGRIKDPNVQFVLCGEGAVVKNIRKMAANLPNIFFLPLQPSEKLNGLLNLADIHLLPQRAEAADLVMPSKLAGIFASGRPVVAMAHPDTEIGKAVRGRGILISPGDASAFADAILMLADNQDERKKLGAAARDFAVRELDRKKILSEFGHYLTSFTHSSKI